MASNSKKSGLIFGIGGLLVLVLIVGIGAIGYHNSIVRAENEAERAWGQVESSYQRRADLIPNLTAVVKEATDREEDILTGVTKARQQATAGTETGDAEALSANQSSLDRLLVTVEAYPEVTSTQGWRDFQAQLEGTENRVTVARNDYNDAARKYNDKIETFPGSVFAGGRNSMDYFEADAGADKAPSVSDELDD